MVVRKMKEKCKDAARMRREKERTEFIELSKLLPLPASITSQLDKASIIRLTSSYLRMRAAFPEGLGANWGSRKSASLSPAASSSNCNAHVASSLSSASSSSAASSASSAIAAAPFDNDVARFNHPAADKNSSAAPEHRQLPTPLNERPPSHRANDQHLHQAPIKELGSLLLQTLDGFVFALHRDGKIMYISETASVLLGLPQIDLTGSSIFDYVHPADHSDLLEMLSLREADLRVIQAQTGTFFETSSGVAEEPAGHLELGRSFSLRMKCILPKRNAGLIKNGFKSIHCTGYLKVRQTRKQLQKRQKIPTCQLNPAICYQSRSNDETKQELNPKKGPSQYPEKSPSQSAELEWDSYALVAVGHSLLPTASTEIKLSKNSFMLRANLDMKIYYIEPTAFYSLGHHQNNLAGQSLYQLVHLADARHLEEAHRMLLSKGQVVSKYFRLMRRDTGYIWIQMQAALVNNPRSMPKPLHIVGICTVIADNHSDQSKLILNQPSLITGQDTESSRASELSLEQICSQRRKVMKSHPSSNSLLNKDLRKKPLLTKSSNAIRRREKQVLPLKRVKNSTGDNKCKIVNENHPDARLLIEQNQPSAQESFTNEYQYNQTIGSMRRPSDDTCSLASSIASANISSSSLFSNVGSSILPCAPSSASSCSSSSSNCSATSVTTSRAGNYSTFDCAHSDDFSTHLTSRPNLIAHIEQDESLLYSKSQYQAYPCQNSDQYNSDAGQTYADHNHYSGGCYWPVNSCKSSVLNRNQLTDNQQDSIGHEQYHNGVADNDQQFVGYYQYNCATFHDGQQLIHDQQAGLKSHVDGHLQAIQYQYHYQTFDSSDNDSISVTRPTNGASAACIVGHNQSF